MKPYFPSIAIVCFLWWRWTLGVVSPITHQSPWRDNEWVAYLLRSLLRWNHARWKRSISVQRVAVNIWKDIIMLSHEIQMIWVCFTSLIIIIEILVRRDILQTFIFLLQVFILSWRWFPDPIPFNLIQTDIKYQQTGYLRFPDFKEKNLLLGIDKLIVRNGYF